MGKAKTVRKTFSRETKVSQEISADAKLIWNILTDSTNYPKWNSTIISIEGKIEPGQQIKLKSQLDPKREFKLKVKEYDIAERLVWGDAMGRREFKLESDESGKTLFSMSEKIGGPLFPLFAKMIPPFDDSFDQFTQDLKTEAESQSAI